MANQNRSEYFKEYYQKNKNHIKSRTNNHYWKNRETILADLKSKRLMHKALLDATLKKEQSKVQLQTI